MTSKFTERRWAALLRRAFPWVRDRHFASITSPITPQKMEPIAKIVADAGRNSATPAD